MAGDIIEFENIKYLVLAMIDYRDKPYMIMYFDYDLIMKKIEMPPKEINEMEDGYDYQVIF